MKITDLIEQLQYLKTAGATQVFFQDYNWNNLEVFEMKRVGDNVVVVLEEEVNEDEGE